jgi:O-antigen ligase
LLAILQYFTSGSLIYWIHETTSGYAFGPYANQNHYAGLMELLIPISVAGMLGRREGHPSRLFWGFATVVALASVLLTGSRGGLIALMAEIAILGTILLRCTPPRRARARWAAVGLGVAASATLFLIIDPGQVSARLATVAEIPTKPEVTLAERRLASRDAMRLFQDHPWGVGLGSFAVAFPQYQSLATDLLWNHAHNDYVEALAETGVAGGFLIVLALVMFLPLAFGRLRERLEHEVGWIQVGAAIGCCGLLAHSLGDFNLHVPANAAWFAVSAALAAQPTIVDRPNDTPCDSR